MYRSEHWKTDGRQDIRGFVDFRELEVHEIRSGRIVESAGNILILNIYTEYNTVKKMYSPY